MKEFDRARIRDIEETRRLINQSAEEGAELMGLYDKNYQDIFPKGSTLDKQAERGRKMLKKSAERERKKFNKTVNKIKDGIIFGK